MDFVNAERILRGFSIPVQPFVVSKILQLIPDLEQISVAIHSDPCLTASVIKLANHTRTEKNKIVSVDEAVQLLGVSGITAMLNAQLLKKAAITGLHDNALIEFWKINNDVAFACGLMARQLNLSMVDDAYYLGLFHNIGMPMIWQKHPEYFEHNKNYTGNLSLCNVENKAFNCSHATVGYYIARGMSLSLNICEAIRLHHDVERVLRSKNSRYELVMILSILKAVEFILGEVVVLHGRDNNSEWDCLKELVLEQLALSEMDFLDLAEIIEEETLMRDGL